jgi:predicted nucleotidyltransferase
MNNEVTKELRELAGILADWANGCAVKIYLFGSRVRGDYKPGSDVDVYLEWTLGNNEHKTNHKTMEWWARENETCFRAINARLPGSLRILEANDPIGQTVRSAPVVHSDGNVCCVWLPPKPGSKAAMA